MPQPAPVIDAKLAEFLGGRRSIIAATCGADNHPHLMRAVGFRLSADKRQVSVLLAASQSRSVLQDLKTNRRIAVVFSEPSTHRTVQLKGEDARVEPTLLSDLRTIETYADAFAAELESVGIEARLARALIAVEPDDLVAVAFTPLEAYDQTPGPRAGERMAR